MRMCRIYEWSGLTTLQGLQCNVVSSSRERTSCLFRSLFPVTYSRRETSPPGFLVPLLFTLRCFLFHFVARIDTPSLNEFSSSGQPTSSVRDSKRTSISRYISGVVRYTYKIAREGTITFGNCKQKFISKTNLYDKFYRLIIIPTYIKLYFIHIFYIKKN